MKLAFCHKYKWSHQDKRKKYRKLLKLGEVVLLKQTKDGWLYGHVNNNRVTTLTEKRKVEMGTLTLTVELGNSKEIAAAIAVLESLGGETKSAKPAKPATGKGKGKGKAKAEEVEAEEEFNFEEPEVEAEEEFEIEEEETEESVSVEDILKAFNAYNKKHGRDKAIAVLKKFKVKSARDIDPKHFEKLLPMLKK